MNLKVPLSLFGLFLAAATYAGRTLPSITVSAAGAAGASTSSPTCEDHFLQGRPPTLPTRQAAQGVRFCYREFAVFHSPATRTPLWSAEYLDGAQLSRAITIERASSFYPEPRLPRRDRAELQDYRRARYDRGHLAPSGDMPDPTSQAESFSLANIIPQAAELNRESWADLEQGVRAAIGRSGHAYVVTGPLFRPNRGTGFATTPTGRVIIPSHVWKAVLIPGRGSAVYVATNDDQPQWRTYALAEFVQETGINPFPAASPKDSTKRLKLGMFR